MEGQRTRATVTPTWIASHLANVVQFDLGDHTPLLHLHDGLSNEYILICDTTN